MTEKNVDWDVKNQIKQKLNQDVQIIMIDDMVIPHRDMSESFQDS